MTLTVKHKFVSLKVDGGDTTLIRPTNWNDSHDISGQAFSVIARKLGTAGLMEDVAIGDGLWFDTAGSKLDVNLVGMVGFFAMNTPLTGWLKANGALVSRTTYANLFAKISTTFGVGDGSTTFALPDLRGYFARGWDDGRGIDASRVFGSSQADQNTLHAHGVNDGTHAHSVYDPTHAHGIGDPGHAHNYTDSTGSGSGWPGTGSGNATTRSTAGAGTGIWVGGSATGISIYASGANISIQNQGGDGRPKNVALLGCIKY